jgi:hypothetical protein
MSSTLWYPWVCLCSVFRPEFYWWQVVLTLRKFCEVAIATLLSAKPPLQVSFMLLRRLCARLGGSLWVGILFMSHSLQVQFKPFMDPNVGFAAAVGSLGSGALQKASSLVHVRSWSPTSSLYLWLASSLLWGVG